MEAEPDLIRQPYQKPLGVMPRRLLSFGCRETFERSASNCSHDSVASHFDHRVFRRRRIFSRSVHLRLGAGVSIGRLAARRRAPRVVLLLVAVAPALFFAPSVTNAFAADQDVKWKRSEKLAMAPRTIDVLVGGFVDSGDCKALKRLRSERIRLAELCRQRTDADYTFLLTLIAEEILTINCGLALLIAATKPG